MSRQVLDGSTLLCTRPPQRAADSPCATCPFIAGNDRALARYIVDMVHPDLPTKWLWIGRIARPIIWVLARIVPGLIARWTRVTAKKIADGHPMFVCHSSLYKFDGRNTKVRPEEEWRLCRGDEMRKSRGVPR